jgi:hypothetical protein
MNEINNEILILNSKIEKCSSLFLSLIKTLRLKAFFDYDMIVCHEFIEVLLKNSLDCIVDINYINIDLCKIVKTISLESKFLLEDPDQLKEFRRKHISLYNCSIEGSYFLSDDKNYWFIFYDAQTDLGVFMTNSESLMLSMSDYLFSPS